MARQPSADVAPWVERLARVGYAAKAVLYITVGYLAAEAGLGPGGRLTDTEGALRVVHQASYGQGGGSADHAQDLQQTASDRVYMRHKDLERLLQF